MAVLEVKEDFEEEDLPSETDNSTKEFSEEKLPRREVDLATELGESKEKHVADTFSRKVELAILCLLKGDILEPGQIQ